MRERRLRQIVVSYELVEQVLRDGVSAAFKITDLPKDVKVVEVYQAKGDIGMAVFRITLESQGWSPLLPDQAIPWIAPTCELVEADDA